MSESDLRAQASYAFDRLYDNVALQDFKGWEFDDALASPIMRRIVGDNLLAQRVAVQVVRRSVVNLRPMLTTPKLESTKARGFLARGLLCAHLSSGKEQWLDEAERHLEWLLQHPSAGAPGLSWGNAFDFASRGGFYPAGSPTVVWSAHIGESFGLAHEITGNPRYLEAVHKIAQFVFEGLERHEDEMGVCIAYSPGVMNLVHNSNLLGATALLRSWAHGGPAEYRALADRSVAWTVTQQAEDGSWPYGVGEHYSWCDNFHTAYCLDCLREIRELSPETLPDPIMLSRGFKFWVDSFFTANGTPRYYADRTYPIDIQCCSQAIETLAKWSALEPSARAKMCQVAGWTLGSMAKRNGAFRFRRSRILSNELESLHWGEATMLSALGRLELALASESGANERGTA